MHVFRLVDGFVFCFSLFSSEEIHDVQDENNRTVPPPRKKQQQQKKKKKQKASKTDTKN